jgi:hypothetical protein
MNHFHQLTTPPSSAPNNFQHPMFANMLNNANMLNVNPANSAPPNNFQQQIVANMMLYQSEPPPNLLTQSRSQPNRGMVTECSLN